MDLGDKGEIRSDKGNGVDHLNYHSTNMSSDWRFSNTNLSNQTLGMVPTDVSVTLPKRDLMGSSASSMVDSFCPWEQPSSKNLGLCDNNVQTSTSTSSAPVIRNGIPIRTGIDMGWDSPNLISRGGASFLQNSGGILPSSLSQFPTDSGFIERAARFSCFNGGNFADMVPFSISESLNLYSSKGGQMQVLPDGNLLKSLQRVASEKTELNMAEVSKDVSPSVEHGATDGSPMKSERDKKRQLMSPNEGKHGIGLSNNESDDAEFSGGGGGQEELAMMEGTGGEPSGAKDFGTKKRKKTGQDTDINQDKGASQGSHEAAKGEAKSKEKVDQNQTSGTSKGSGKFSKDGSVDAVKEDYIHVRARRGQATNSHSLAERVRREKISERMKFLQELVPGCSKVTGKAVMLDEIINYVQSLQRQVEFLSMKLATVNPRLDLNIEGLLAKDILQSQGGPSAMGFSPDMSMVHPQLHPSQQGLMQAGIPSLGNSSDTLRRTINSQLAAMGGYKDLTQAASVWDDEYHNIVQMSFGTNAPFNSQDLNGSLPSGHMKAEL